MRIWGVFVAIGLLTPIAAADVKFPYQARIAHEATLVRCGPGESYYATSRILRGEEVEVHRHDGNGWCAIRPPQSEFSLIAARHVKLLPGDDMVEVVGSEATVWVGSHLAKPNPHRWQIHLQPGERAIVLGVRAAANDDRNLSGHWYKIAPPAGEFRWIPREAIALAETIPQANATVSTVETPNPDVSLSELPEPESSGASVSEFAEPAKLVANDAVRLEPGSLDKEGVPPPLSGMAMKDSPAVTAVGYDAPLSAVSSLVSPTPEAPVQTATTEAPVAPSNTPAPTTNEASRSVVETTLPLPVVEADRRIELTPRSESEAVVRGAELDESADDEALAVSAKQFHAEASALTLELTIAVAKDLSQWRLGPLQDRAERLRQEARSPEECDRADALLHSIARFDELYARYRRMTVGRTNSPPILAAPSPETFPDASDEGPTAAGVLASVASDENTPPYVLIDEDGQIAAYIAPARGIDLNPHLGSRISVYGKAEKVDSLTAPRVTATKAVPESLP